MTPSPNNLARKSSHPSKESTPDPIRLLAHVVEFFINLFFDMLKLLRHSFSASLHRGIVIRDIILEGDSLLGGAILTTSHQQFITIISLYQYLGAGACPIGGGGKLPAEYGLASA